MEKSLEEIYAEIEVLKQQAESIRAEKVAEAKREVRRLIGLFELSATDCGFSGAKSGASTKNVAKIPVAIKYRHPDNEKLTWTGRGKTPNWLLQVESEGRSRNEFLV